MAGYKNKITKIIILSVGNLNVGDNAILFNWLYFYQNLYGSKCRITIYGSEVSYLSELTADFPYKVIVSNSLHRYIWEAYDRDNDAKTKKAIAELIEADDSAWDKFNQKEGLIPRSLLRNKPMTSEASLGLIPRSLLRGVSFRRFLRSIIFLRKPILFILSAAGLLTINGKMFML